MPTPVAVVKRLLRIPVRAYVAGGDCRKRQSCIEVKIHVDVPRVRQQVDELQSHKTRKQSTCDQEHEQPDKSTNTADTEYVQKVNIQRVTLQNCRNTAVVIDSIYNFDPKSIFDVLSCPKLSLNYYLRAVGRKVLWSSVCVCLSVCVHFFCPQDISRTGSWITTKFGRWEQGVNL